MNVTKQCRYGDIIFRPNDRYIGRSFELYGEFSEGEVELFRQLVRPGQTVLDVGANIGAHTVPLAQIVGPVGRVLAFEPQRTVYYLLCGNVVQNNLERTVHCLHAALGDRPGTIDVPDLPPDTEQNFGGLSLDDTKWSGGEQVPVMRVDDLALTACDLIKVDVEGMEREVLVGAAETICRFRPLLYVEDDRAEKSPALRALLASYGYQLYLHRPRLFNAQNYFGQSQNVFGNTASYNLYAHHAETASPIRPEAFGMQPVDVERRRAKVFSGGPCLPSGGEEPTDLTACLEFGLALYEQGQLDEALFAFQQAAAERPDLAEAHDGAGLVYVAQGRSDDAIAAYRRAAALKPQFAAAHHHLGVALHDAGQLEPALASCREAVRLAPDFALAYLALGNVLQALGRHEESLPVLRDAVRLDPQLAHAHHSLGLGYWQLNRLAEAVASYRRALECDPGLVEAECNLGGTLSALGEFDAAMSAYNRAIELNPELADARWNRALLALLQGDFARGWSDYEYRWRLKNARVRDCPQPIWDGSPLEGRSILLAAEQGLGDTLQLLRYAPLLQKRGARVIAEVHRPLRRLAKSCPGVDKVVIMGDPPPVFDTYVPMLSLPRLFHTTLETVPADVPYLWPEATMVEQWRSELAALPGFKVGIAWKGSPLNTLDRWRSIPLAMFEPLAKVPGVTLVSLQKGVGSEQIRQVADRVPVHDFGPRLDETSGPFVDTAAIMKSLDLVVTCDSALAHLAGAMAVPVWIALPHTPDWRWLLHRADSPWYPTARLFRQDELGDWPGVFARMAEALRSLVESAAAGPADQVGVATLLHAD